MNEKWVPISVEDDVYPMGDFINNCNSGGFIDYDGFGHYARNVKRVIPEERCKFRYNGYNGEKLQDYDNEVKPSMVKKNTIDTSYTHIVWYNR